MRYGFVKWFRIIVFFMFAVSQYLSILIFHNYFEDDLTAIFFPPLVISAMLFDIMTFFQIVAGRIWLIPVLTLIGVIGLGYELVAARSGKGLKRGKTCNSTPKI